MQHMRLTSRILQILALSLTAVITFVEDARSQAPKDIRLISADFGNCLVAEVVINGVLVGHALETRDGPLSSLAEGIYPATTQYFAPDLLLIRRSGDFDVTVRVIITTEESANGARVLSEEYRAKSGIGLSRDLSLAVSVDTNTCIQDISAVPKISGKPTWAGMPFFDQLYKATIQDVAGSFSQPVRLSVERPIATEFRRDNHVFRRTGSTWVEMRGDRILATYDETGRHLAGFDLLDRQRPTVRMLGSQVSVPRIVHVPSGFEFWLPGQGRTAIRVYRPTDEGLLNGPRLDIPNPMQLATVAVKSFIRRIVVEGPADGEPLSAATAKRLGFDGMVGGRNTALAFALETDANFSELPNDDLPLRTDFRLYSRVRVRAECLGDTIKDYQKPTLDTAFGKEASLEAVGVVSKPLSIVESRSAAGRRSLRMDYEIAGRPNAFTLGFFIAVQPRSCSWIWHSVSIHLQCGAGRLEARTTIAGSAFPSRRTWVNGSLVDDTDQGPFDSLWVCDKADPTRVK